MGCGQSKENGGISDPARREPVVDQVIDAPPSLTVRKRKSIFESTDVETTDMIQTNQIQVYVFDDYVKNILEKSLAEYFGIEKSSAEYLKLDLFIHTMEREEFDGGTTILTEGQLASKFYVIEFGYVQITVKSAFVKTLGKGGVIGELSLKDEEQAVLKSTAHCITKVVLWSLKKEDLQKIEFCASSEMLLRGSLYEYFGVDKYSTEQDKIDLFVKSMVREEIKSGTTLIVEGDVGSKLYIIESGYFQISIKGAFIRTIGKGKILGDLALLYDSPRSASAHSITDSVLWSLHRDVFRQINIQTSSNLFKKRAKWLINCPELATLSAVNFTRLVNSFQSKEIAEGITLYLAKTLATECVLLESGRAVVYVPSEDMIAGKTPQEIDFFLGISRPAYESKRKLSLELVDYINGTPPSLSADDNEIDSALKDRADMESRPDSLISSEETTQLGRFDVSADSNGVKRVEGGVFACEIYEGCLIGTGALRQSSETDDTNAWKATNRTWKFADGSWHALKTSYGIMAPITVKTTEIIKACGFSFESYDKMLESPDSVQVDDYGDDMKSENSAYMTVQTESADNVSRNNFDISMFRAKYVLGKGSFAIVLFSEMRSDDVNKTTYALKIYDKKDVANNNQLKNVMKSCSILRKLNNPFVIRLLGTFQTPHQLYMVLEPLLHGSLWDVMNDPPYSKLGLPNALVQFYIASIVLGLAHVHHIGAGYRELKPENVMMDSSGYIRLIDFGMCKKIPYTKIDSRGNHKLFSKSYTLFGTPGKLYLEPSYFLSSLTE
jgi:CRP-like cAMP-binding protein